jgi:hypothetical protein
LKTQTKQRGSWQHMGIATVPPFDRQKFPKYFKQYSEHFAVFQKFYLLHNFSLNPYECLGWETGLSPQVDPVLSQFYTVSANFYKSNHNIKI